VSAAITERSSKQHVSDFQTLMKSDLGHAKALTLRSEELQPKVLERVILSQITKAPTSLAEHVERAELETLQNFQ
jgi:hypothetical protein